MNKLTRVERLNYEDANNSSSRSDHLIDLQKYGFIDTDVYTLVGDKNPYMLKQEFGSNYPYLNIEYAYNNMKKIGLSNKNVAELKDFELYMDNIGYIEYKNPYTLILSYIASDLSEKNANKAFAFAEKINEETYIDKHDIMTYAYMWNNVKRTSTF